MNSENGDRFVTWRQLWISAAIIVTLPVGVTWTLYGEVMKAVDKLDTRVEKLDEKVEKKFEKLDEKVKRILEGER
jgi:hypothetical protein